MITCQTFHDIWLNEGFAVYSEALYHEQQYGEADFHNKRNDIIIEVKTPEDLISKLTSYFESKK